MKKNKKTKVPPVLISHNMFIGVQWDKSTLETITIVARALENLTTLFKTQHVETDSLLKVGDFSPLQSGGTVKA